MPDNLRRMLKKMVRRVGGSRRPLSLALCSLCCLMTATAEVDAQPRRPPARRGDEFLFILNGPDSPPQEAQIGLKKTIKNLPRNFRVMLYGFGSSENNWDSVRVVVAK